MKHPIIYINNKKDYEAAFRALYNIGIKYEGYIDMERAFDRFSQTAFTLTGVSMYPVLLIRREYFSAYVADSYISNNADIRNSIYTKCNSLSALLSYIKRNRNMIIKDHE